MLTPTALTDQATALPGDRRYVEIHEEDLHIEVEGSTPAIARRLIELATELLNGER